MNCPNCQSSYDVAIDTCLKCGFPFLGTDDEKAKFIGQQVLKVGHIDDAQESLRLAKAILFIISGINIVSAFLVTKDPGVMAFTIIIGIIFLMCGILVEKSPMPFMIFPLVFLLFSYLMAAVADPTTIAKGAVLKILFVGSLAYGIVRVRRATKLRKESKYLDER